MKKVLLILSILIIISCKGNDEKTADSLAVNSKREQDKLKRYKVKSGIVKYKITTNGKVLGSVITGSGTESLYFKNFGAIELNEEISSQTTKTNVFGVKSTNTTNTHTMNKLDNGESYHVDFKQKIIYLRRDLAMDMIMSTNGDAGKTGKNMLSSIGGKKIGNEVVKGYNCEIWDLNGIKQWIYKGVLLRIESNLMGIKTVKEATSADFNTVIATHQLKLPNFKIQKEEGFLDNEEYKTDMEEMDANMGKLSKMSFTQWKKLALADKEDEEMQNMSEAELRKTYNMVQKMIKMRKGN